MSQRWKKYIAVCIILILAVTSAIFLLSFSRASNQTIATVYLDGVPIYTVDLSQVTQTETFTVGTSGAQNTIQVSPEGIAIICANNDDMAIAAAKAAADSGNEAYANTIFLGFDGIQSACDAILEGRLTMSVAQQGYEMGYMAVEAVVNALNGETIEEFIDSGADVVTADNAQERKDTLQGYLDAVA